MLSTCLVYKGLTMLGRLSKTMFNKDGRSAMKKLQNSKRQTNLPDFVAELMALSARLKPSADPDDQTTNS